MQILRKRLLIPALLIMSSCTTLSEDECRTLDWKEKGRADGLRGKSSQMLAKYQEACLKHGLSVNQALYTEGREQGLRLFCTNENGHEWGLSGKNYDGVCPASSEASFVSGYRIGRKEWELKNKERELQQREAELEEQERDLRLKHRIRKQYKTCNFDSDCVREANCRFRKCEHSGRSCTFNSDCATKGRCRPKRICIDNDCENMDVCRY